MKCFSSTRCGVFTHASASDGSRAQSEGGLWQVGRASILHNGRDVRVLGGAMLVTEDNFDNHSYETEVEAMTDTAAAVQSEASAMAATVSEIHADA